MVLQKYTTYMGMKNIFVEIPINQVEVYFANGKSEGIEVWVVKRRNFWNLLKQALNQKWLFFWIDFYKEGKTEIRKNKKGGKDSTFFAPNLTMNLTYLCYGRPKNKPWCA